ncbi:MAG: DUF2279 domain-containing protein [Cyclobacteriaceae bacterium]|nr:DUF2279 domain-containing protein [Cyclobacteriaceae bacterium]
MRSFIGAVAICLLFSHQSHANVLAASDSSGIDKKRLGIVLVGTGVAYGVSLAALSQAWYTNRGTSFHFFNDNSEWNQVDKAGHFYSAYQLSRVGNELFLWTNMSEKKSAIWGSVMSQAFMVTIDIFDGFSDEYGFSWGDISANLLGSGLFLSQELLFKEQKIKVKYSFHFTEYAAMRPELLGSTPMEEILKDYNGHTYWLSFDVYSIFNKSPIIPKWLNLAVGYGAEGMVYGHEYENNANGYQSYRQFYLALDPDLSYIRTRSKLLKSLLFFADMIHIPAPTLEYNSQEGFMYHWFYF